MKRLGRWLFNLAAVFSLALWLLTVLIYLVSYWKTSFLHRQGIPNSDAYLFASYGRILFSCTRNPRVGEVDSLYEWRMEKTSSEPDYLGLLDFRWSVHGITLKPPDPEGSDVYIYIKLPLWLPTLGFAWPIVFWVRQRRRIAETGIHCTTCGYDLRATPDRCPECGVVPEEAKGFAR